MQSQSNQIKSNVGFGGEGKTGVPGEEPLGAEQRNNKPNPHTVTPNPGIEPEAWVEGERSHHCAIRAHLKSW